MARLRRARLPAVPRSMPRQYRAVSPLGVTEQGAAQIRLQSLKGVRGGRSLRARANRARQLRTAPTTPSGYRLAGSLQATFRHRTHGDLAARVPPGPQLRPPPERSLVRDRRYRHGDAFCGWFDRRRQKAQLFNALGRGCASVGSERLLPLRSNTAQRAMRLRSRQQRNASPG